MQTNNILNGVKTKRLWRNISFFGKKKPPAAGADKVFDIKSCSDCHISCLKVNDTCSLAGCCSLPKVVVVGAGLAGMSAASRLLQAGIKDLTLVEATDRPGGRILSAWVGDAMIELGPNVLQGASIANPVYNLANMGGALPSPAKRLTTPKRIYLTSDGKLITDYSIESLIFNQLISEAAAKKQIKPPSCSCNTQCNLMQNLGLRVQQEILKLPANMQRKSEMVLWGMINSLREQFGAELSSVGAGALSHKTKSPGGSIALVGGMHTILAPLIRHLPENILKFNSPVYKILLRSACESDRPVSVITCNGNVFDADYVVVAVPLGVLKKGGKDMLAGAITPEQSRAINNIKVGMKNHVYLEYANPWWVPGMADLTLAWTMDQLQNSRDWTKGIGSISEVPGSKHLLSMSLTGQEAELIESVSEEEVAIQLTKFLRKFTGDTSIPYPANIVVTRWACDPNFLGSTVYVGLDTSPGMFRDLAGGPCDTGKGPPALPIIFAGDATIPKYFGTMEGARRSGIRAANQIISSTKMKCQAELDKEEEDEKCSPSEEDNECTESQQRC